MKAPLKKKMAQVPHLPFRPHVNVVTAAVAILAAAALALVRLASHQAKVQTV